MEALPTEKVSELKAHVGPVLAVRFNRDGNYCLTCGQDRLIKLWNPTKGLVVKTYVGHGHEVFDVATADDNSRLASVGGDKLVFYWDVATGNIIRKFRRARAARQHRALRGGRVSGDNLRELRQERSHLRLPITEFRGRADDAGLQGQRDLVAVSGHQVCAASVDGFIRTFDIRMGEMVSDCVGQPITCVTVTNDGNCVLATCMDSKVRLFDKSNGELLASYSGHKNSTYTVESCMTHGDAHVVCGSEDGDVYFWDLVSGKQVHKLSGHGNVVCGIAYHPSETCLLTSSVD
eukprot:CAMPEP_0180387356 /NCGR_PEP_ID=MMETSP0989-20121125/30186_1 /TAXON_ID=697907 /ORGANISM="non described non described, Strain CCMP2293" /LENGTH=290 /DNA_ID=CAMNT_0022388195 /DNA_START=211 /DNA_END=1081 /DNA_ORIENTATION=+